jgi:hypothetical protein
MQTVVSLLKLWQTARLGHVKPCADSVEALLRLSWGGVDQPKDACVHTCCMRLQTYMYAMSRHVHILKPQRTNMYAKVSRCISFVVILYTFLYCFIIWVWIWVWCEYVDVARFNEDIRVRRREYQEHPDRCRAHANKITSQVFQASWVSIMTTAYNFKSWRNHAFI